MCEKAVEDDPYNLEFVPDHFKTKKMCITAAEKEAETLEHFPDLYKT